MSLIEVKDLQKSFTTYLRRDGFFGTFTSLFRPIKKEVDAVTGINFNIEKGESVAYLGPNGAGKSTTIKMLSGILEPSSGSVTVGGLTPSKNRKQNSYQIGVVFGQRSQLILDLPVKDSFELLRYMYGVDRQRYQRNMDLFIDMLDIGSFINHPVRTLSLGQRMRCEMIAALIHEPEVLFLDEPTIGLDVVAKEKIRAFIEQINKQNKVTVLLTTHDLSDIERLCNRLIIIDKGQLIYDGSLSYIQERYATERKIKAIMPDVWTAEQATIKLQTVQQVEVQCKENQITVSYDQNRFDTSELLRQLLHYEPRDLSMQDENIESLIRRIYAEELDVTNEAAAGRGDAR